MVSSLGSAAPRACSSAPDCAPIDQRHMGERLREVADQPPRVDVVLLRQQPDVVAQRQQPVEQALRPPRRRPVITTRRPARSEQARKAPSPCASPVSISAGSWRITKPSCSRRRSTARDGAHDARVVGRQETGGGDQQQAAVEPLRAVGLHEAAQLGVVAVGADVVVDLPRHRAPALDRSFQAELFGELDAAIEGHPGHHLAEGEVARRARGSPRCRGRAGARSSSRCARKACIRAQASSLLAMPPRARLVERVHDLAVDVELELAVRARCRCAPAWRPRSPAASRPPIRSAGARR